MWDAKKEKKVIDTLWEELPITVDLETYLTRIILVEKYNSKKAKEIKMIEFFISKLHNCKLFINTNYPDYIFYGKSNSKGENEILMEKNEKNKYYNIKYSNFWQVFEDEFKLNYTEIQLFTQELLEDLLNSKGYKTNAAEAAVVEGLEDLLNSKGYKTFMRRIGQYFLLEDLLNSKGYKTPNGVTVSDGLLEDLLNSKGYKTHSMTRTLTK